MSAHAQAGRSVPGSDAAQTCRRVHVVGCHRSGTTLMMELLWYAYPFSGRRAHEESVFNPAPQDAPLYLSKKPPDTTRLRKVFLADERLHVIALQRDPRSVISSIHPDRPGVYFSSFRRWRDYAAAIDTLIDHPRFLMVRYEDLLREPAAVQARIEARFAFLQPRRAFAQYPEGAEVPENASVSMLGARPFDTTRIDGWREHLPRIQGALAQHPDLADALIRYGYESDRSWQAALDGVAPYTQSYKEEAPALPRRFEANLRYWWKTRRYLARLHGSSG
ncbi:MAG: hypothetical protein R3E82_23130 [Pseudomonadales bacterium]|nr:hypothetical protein [Pseudomonadales bacterium]